MLNRLWHTLKTVVTAVLDPVPPYRRIEGRLLSKEIDRDGRYLILVDGEIVQVDWLTFDTLMIGEALKIRSTRGNKAVNIDRLLP